MKVELIRTMEAFERLAEDWHELLRNVDEAEVFDTWDWTLSSLESAPPGPNGLFVIAVYDEERCAAIAPLRVEHRRKWGVRIRTLRFINDKTSSYNGFYLHRDYHRIRLVRAISDTLVEHAGEWDVMALSNLSSRSPATDFFKEAFGERYRLVCEETDFTLSLHWGKAKPKLNEREMKGIERRARKLEAEHRVEVALDRGYSDDLWRRALQLHQAKWERTLYREESHLSFYGRLLPRLDRLGQVRFSYIAVDGRVEAIAMCFRYRRKVYGEIVNFNPDYAKWGLGLILIKRCLEHYESQGMEEFDFKQGSQAYKFYWTDTVYRNCSLYVGNESRMGALASRYMWLRVAKRRYADASGRREGRKAHVKRGHSRKQPTLG